MDLDVETLKQHIQPYLAAEDQEDLIRALKSFSTAEPVDFVLSDYNDSFKTEMLQGDGWRGLELFIFETGSRAAVRGIILSNSCDISDDNKRDLPTKVSFAPLFDLALYQTDLIATGLDPVRVAAKLEAIKAQKVSSIFYLPQGGSIDKDYIIKFDEIHSVPVSAHREHADREKLFTLSNFGFYLFIFKLSVHFCRLQEGVNRKLAL